MEFTWIGSNMPHGILMGVPGGGRRSGRGSRGVIIGVAVFSSVEVSFPVTSGVNVVGGTGNLVGGLGLGSKRGERNSHPSR